MIGKTRVFGFLALRLYSLGSFLSQRLPLAVSYALADFLADVHFQIRRRPRRALLSNLDVACGPGLSAQDRRRLARTIFRNFGRVLVDFLRLPALDERRLRRSFSAEGLERLDSALGAGVGPVLLTGHIGGWELGGVYLSSLGYPIAAVALDHPTEAVTDFFHRRRRDWRVRVLRAGERGAVAGLLERGECLAVLGDWDASGSGTPVAFFGRRTRVPWAYVNLAARAGATILPGVVVRNRNGGYRLRLDEPIRPVRDDARAALEDCLRILEGHILENVTQWFAFNPIWPEESRSPAPTPGAEENL